MAQPIKVRLAMANGMNSRLCFLAKEEINRLENKAQTFRDDVSRIVNQMDIKDATYAELKSLIAEFDGIES